jgi:hypothetical protein
MNVNKEILENLSSYFRNEMRLDALRVFIVDLYLQQPALEEDDKKFLAEFEGHYAELSDHLISEDVFRQLLAAAIISSVQPTAQPQLKFLVASASTGSYAFENRSARTSYSVQPELTSSHA